MKLETIGLLLLGALLVSQSGTLFSGVGFTTLQLREINFIDSTDPSLQGKVWSATVVPVGEAQWIEGYSFGGTFDKSLITDGNNQATRNLKVDVTMHQQRCSYPIQIDANAVPIYYFDAISISRDLLGNCIKPGIVGGAVDMYEYCSQYGTPIAWGSLRGSYDCGCIYVVPSTANIGTFPSDTAKLWETQIMIQNGLGSASGTVNNQGTPTILLKDASGTAIARITSIDLASGIACPSSTQYLAGGGGNSWSIISKSAYDTYRTKFNSNFGGAPIDLSKTELFALSSEMQSAANLAKTPVKWNGGAAFGDAKQVSGTVYFDSSAVTSNPIIQMYIKADWLGVVQPEGIPDITCTEKTKTIGSGGGSIGVSVKNIGTGRGTATVSASCASPVQGGTPATLTLQPGETANTGVDVTTAMVSQKTTVSCNMIARIGTKEDSCSVSVTVNPDVLCVSGQTKCSGDSVLTCNEFGTGWYAKDCGASETCTYVNMNAVCQSTECPDCLPNECNCRAGDIGCRASCAVSKFLSGFMTLAIIVVAVYGGYLVWKGWKRK